MNVLDTNECKKYLMYLMRSMAYCGLFLSLSTGIRVRTCDTNWKKLREIDYILPRLIEQQAIANFLDAKCAEIDALSSDIQTQIDTLEQYKRSVISEVVTRGLDPNVPTKDSGIAWVGKIPASWTCVRGKFILKYLQKPVRSNDGVITCFRDGEVTLRSNRREEGFTMSDKEIGYQGVDKGDLVVHGMDGFAGAIGISDSRGKASPVLNVLDTQQNKKYIMYYLRSMAYGNVFTALATGIRVRSCDLRWNKLAELYYPIPSQKEQNAIVEFIDSALHGADAVIAQKQEQLDTLADYKKSLIYEYVTGKKEVPCAVNDILTEKQYQHEIMDYLQDHDGYRIRKATDYDRAFAMDRGMLFEFLNQSQPDVMDELRKIFKEDTEETIVNVINQSATSEKSSLVEVLKSGIEISNRHLDLMYTKPATTFNKTLNRLYDTNILSVMEEVWASDEERIDLVIFLNGLAIISFELKCNAAGQSYRDAILQYRTARSPKTRLFRFKAGCVVNFAMDLNEVYMTTRLNGDATFFMPFNMGNGTGVDAGAGNPIFKDRYSVSYMWEDILTKDTILDLLSKFIFVERKETVDEATGKNKRSETLIFPRYHQLDLIRKLLASVYEHGSSLNYLIEHSAGSGKTNSIAWLTYRLASLHDADNRVIFDNIIIVTDRVVVDRQLQKAILGMDHKAGLIRVMDDRCTSADLAYELSHNTKIIATTIQKFPYIVDTVANLKDKKFAVIIDEAHSSTAGKDMQAVTQALGSGDQTYTDADDMINDQIEKSGKQANVSMFAFTATPKDKTLRLFGRLNPQGQYEAFHLYSMKQAIEEGYILDVLQNFTEYQTMFLLNKEIEEDPTLKTDDAKKQIARFIELHETNIAPAGRSHCGAFPQRGHGRTGRHGKGHGYHCIPSGGSQIPSSL